MKIAIICFTAHGADTAVRIREALKGSGKSKGKDAWSGAEVSKDRGTSGSDRASGDRGRAKNRGFSEDEKLCVRVWCAKSDYVFQPETCGDPDHGLSPECEPGGRVEPLQLPLRQWTQEAFAKYEALVFVGATGIAVRSIAPFLKSKTSDPAVLCVDELGKFVIPLVSGHIGGANALAARLSEELGAVAVITTATDLNGKFAVDVFAKKNQLWISDMKLAKKISADVLDGKKIGFFTDFPVVGELPTELEPWEASAKGRGICVTLDEAKRPFEQTLTLVPRIVSIGVGCRKNADPALIEKRIVAVLRSCGVSLHSVERLASIDIKAEEPGLLGFADKYGIEFITYSAQELMEAPGEFSESAFVEAVTGVSNVCERSAALASGGQGREQRKTEKNDIQTDECGRNAGSASGGKTMTPRCGKLIQKKTAGDGVTVALAVRDWSVEFG